MTHSPLRRALATFLVAQPILWMNGNVYAQTLQPSPSFGVPPLQSPATTGVPSSEREAATSGAGALNAPPGLGETEVVHGERAAPAGRPAVTPLDEPVDPDRYVCGPGDVFDLNFWGMQNFRMTVTVDVEGRAFVARLGYFRVGGKTLTEARQLMKASVSSYFPRLNFDVTLAQPRTFLVQVVDAVKRPATVQARATERVASAIDKAGGFEKGASRRRIEVRRRDGTVLTADLLLFEQTGDVAHNPYLLDGDVVRVPFEEVAVTVSGAVNRPGRYELVKTRDLAEVVELAGGLAPSATLLLPITIVRRSTADRPDLELVKFEEGVLPALALQPEDAVGIPSVTDLQQSVTVIGAIVGAVPSSTVVGGPRGTASSMPAPDEATGIRHMPFVEGDTVRTLLARVGGLGPLADLSGSYIVREGTTVPVDLNRLLMLRQDEADRPIKLGDTLVIPFKRRTVLVEGAVFAPGAYPFNPVFGVEQYLSLAGGLDRNAQGIEHVRMITPDGKTQPYRADLKIEPGSSLVVPERNFSRPEIVQIIMGAAGILLSGVAVVISAKALK